MSAEVVARVSASARATDDEASSCGNHSDGPNLSDSDPKDSGIECGSPDQDVPDEETADAILKTVEFYLSDANILKDAFLLKHVRRNKEGYVSLKLLASFRRVRSLSRNWKAVAHAVHKSALLSLNAEGTKVRRLTPLPDYDETATSRSVLVSGFGSEKPSVDSVGEMFSSCGDIALVRILRPGGCIPPDVKRFLSKNQSLQSSVCALVEFEEHAAARRALGSAQADGISVVSVGAESPQAESPKKKKKNRKPAEAKAPEGEQKRSRRSSSGSVSSGYLSSSPISNPFEGRLPRRHSYHPVVYNEPSSPFASLASRHFGSRDRLQRADVPSPWRRRRLMLSDSSLAPAAPLLQGLPVKTLRMPRGPDGTSGFCTRGKSRLPSTAE